MRMIQTVITGALIATVPTLAAAQSFEGVIVAKIRAGGDAMQVTTSYKDTKARMEMGERGGMGYMITDMMNGTMTMVMPEQKMYMTMDAKAMAEMGGEAAKKVPAAKITSTGKTETIAGHECEHYTVTTDDASMDICAAKGLGFMGMMGAGGPMGRGNSAGPSIPVEYAELAAKYKEGFQPLKIERVTGDKRELVLEVISIEKKKVSGELFAIPAGYSKFDMNTMRGR